MVEQDPQNPEAESARFVQFAEVHMLQATMAEGHDRDVLLAEAKDALIRAEHLSPGSGAWRLACLNAYTGKHKLCLEWLERARAKGSLPAKDAITGDPHFAGVRKQKWFKQFLQNCGV